MFCARCGKELPDEVFFCPSCDAAVSPAATQPAAVRGKGISLKGLALLMLGISLVGALYLYSQRPIAISRAHVGSEGQVLKDVGIVPTLADFQRCVQATGLDAAFEYGLVYHNVARVPYGSRIRIIDRKVMTINSKKLVANRILVLDYADVLDFGVKGTTGWVCDGNDAEMKVR